MRHHVSRPQADCWRTKCQMGEAKGHVEERVSDCQPQAPHFSGRSGANQGGGTGTMGEGQGGEEVSVASEIEEPHRTPEDILNE